MTGEVTKRVVEQAWPAVEEILLPDFILTTLEILLPSSFLSCF